MKDKELNLEGIEVSDTLGGVGEGHVQFQSEGESESGEGAHTLSYNITVR